MASESLIWQLVRNSNSFLHKRGNTKRDGAVQFSSEPGNLLNVHSFKHSGLANHKTVDLQVTAKGEKDFSSHVVMKKKNFKSAATLVAHSNAKSVSKIPLNKGKKAGTKSVKALVGTGKGTGKGKKEFTYAYRPDLVATATLRFQKLQKVADVRNGKIKKARAASKREAKRA